MLTRRRDLFVRVLKGVDLLILSGSFLLATMSEVREIGSITLSAFLSMRIKVVNVLLCLVLLFLWHMVFSVYGLYDSRRWADRVTDVLDSIGATTTATLSTAALLLLFRVKMATLDFFLAFWLSASVIVATQRVAQRTILEQIRRYGRNLRHMLIVGTNARALKFARQIEASPQLGYRIIGFVDQQWNGVTLFSSPDYSVVSDFRDFPDFIREHVVDEVVIALPMGSMHSWAANIAVLCEQQGIITRLLPNLFDLKLSHTRVDDLDGTALVTQYAGREDVWPTVIKRIVDVFGSAVLITGFMPVMAIIALLIKLTSPGPVLFKQRRLGYNKRLFKIYKFRTMIVDAEARLREVQHLNEMTGPVFKIKDDPRVTRIGKFLRQTSLDELPQLFNVLKGDMSLVGPRPLPVRDYEGFHEDWQRRRFSVKPGLTCLWQINGRNSVPFDKWMQLDLQYIDKWSLWLDFKILAKTVPAVLRGSGAA